MNPDLIFKKLRLFPHQQKLIVNASAEFITLLADMPHDTQIVPEKRIVVAGCFFVYLLIIYCFTKAYQLALPVSVNT